MLYEQTADTNIAAISVRTDIMQSFLSVCMLRDNRSMTHLGLDELHLIRRYCTEIITSEGAVYHQRVRLLLGRMLFCLAEAEIMPPAAMPRNFEQLLARASSLYVIAEGVPALLRLSNYSFTRLSRLMKRYLNMTPGEYITSLRLQYAYEMIVCRNERYEEICEKVGFSSFSHFTKLIRERYGMTPARIRRQNMDSTRTV